jgi:hypothetical protein
MARCTASGSRWLAAHSRIGYPHLSPPCAQQLFIVSQGQDFEATMQDYKEIDRIRKNLAEVRSLAKRLLDLSRADWNDWEIDFLQHMARQKGPDPITTRQCEKLLEVRDDAEYYSLVRGFSVQSLIKNCWLARYDLDSEDDRKFIEHLKETSCSCLKRRQLRKLLTCARQLSEIEQYVSIDR